MMKKEKLVISLIVMICLIFILTVNTLAAGDSSITVRPNPNSTASPSTNSSVSIGGGNNNVGAGLSNGTNQTINPGNNVGANSAGTGSSYRNMAASTNTDNKASGLPYTGSSGYGVFFVIVALAVSAVYAYKKVSDYNI